MKRVGLMIVAVMLCLTLSTEVRALDLGYEPSESYAAGEFYQRILAVEPSGSAVTDVLNVALSQLGYHEGERGDFSGADPDGNANYTEYGRAFPYEGGAWCAMFVDWCARRVGLGWDVIGHTSLANPNYFGLRYYSPLVYTPKTGDLLFFGTERLWTHVALVIAVEGGRVYTVEGNRCDAVRLGSYSLQNQGIKAVAPWSNNVCSLADLGLHYLWTLGFEPNGGQGEMEGECASNLRPVTLYVNQVGVDDSTGDPLFNHYIYREGFRFAGWYVRRDSDGAWLTESGFQQIESIAAGETSRIVVGDGAELSADESWSGETFDSFTLHAVWEDASGGLDNDVTAYIPRADDSGWVNPFYDLKESAWYYANVRSVVNKGLMEGMDGSEFAPEGFITRAQAVTLVHRISGSPPAEGSACFADVPAGVWYEEALNWAFENGYVEGMEEGLFAPKGLLTRYQLLTLLSRMDGVETVRVLGEDTVPDWARAGVEWAETKGLDGEGAPDIPGGEPLSRGACAYILDGLY